MAEESFVRSNKTVSGVVSAIDRGRDEEDRVDVVRNIGPLFLAQTQGSAQARTSGKHSRLLSVQSHQEHLFGWRTMLQAKSCHPVRERR